MLMVSTPFLAQCETVVEGRADNNLGNWELFNIIHPAYENFKQTHPMKILNPSYENIEITYGINPMKIFKQPILLKY